MSLKNWLSNKLGTLNATLRGASDPAQATDTVLVVEQRPGGAGDVSGLAKEAGGNLASILAAMATAAKQDTGNASLASIFTDMATAAKQDTGNTTLASMFTVMATAAKQDTGNTTLASILSGMSTAGNQASGNATLTSILNALQATVDLETSLWTDDSLAYFVRRESVNEGTGVITITWTAPDGTAATPGSGLRPLVKDANFQVETATYTAKTNGTGYSQYDIILHTSVLNVGTNPPTVASSFWLNATTNAVIAAPTPTDLDDATSTLLKSIFTQLQTIAANQTNGTQVVTNLALGGVADAAATDSTASWSVVALLKGLRNVAAAIAAQLPASLGAKLSSASFSMVPASDAIFNIISTPTASSAATALPTLGTARAFATSGTSATIALSTTLIKAVKITAKDASIRLRITNGSSTAVATDHYLAAGSWDVFRIDLAAMPAPFVSAIQDSAAGSCEITELN